MRIETMLARYGQEVLTRANQMATADEYDWSSATGFDAKLLRYLALAMFSTPGVKEAVVAGLEFDALIAKLDAYKARIQQAALGQPASVISQTVSSINAIKAAHTTPISETEAAALAAEIAASEAAEED